MTAAWLLLAWTCAGLAVWLARFTPDPARVAAAWRAGPGAGAFDPASLLEAWGEAGAAWVVVAGALSAAARAGAATGAWLRSRPGAEGAAVFRIALGLGMAGLGIHAVGLAGLLLAPPPGVAFAGLGLSAGAGAGAWAFGKRRRATDVAFAAAPGRIARGAVAVALAVALAGTFGPETGWDALTYHLRLPLHWDLRHKISDARFDYYDTYPHLTESLYVALRLAGGDPAARWFEAATALLVAAAAANHARRLGGSPRLAGMILLSSPVVLALIPRAYTDLHLALFGALAISAAARGAWGVAGVFAGFATGAKYVGILAVPAALAAGAAARRLPSGRWLAAVAATGALWPLRNWLRRGNPAEPFLGALFGTGTPLPESVIPFFERNGGWTGLLTDLPRRAGALLLDPGHLQSPLSPAVALWLPLILWPGAAPDRFAARLRAGAVGWLAVWWLLAPDVRFALAAAVPAAAMAAAALARLSPGGSLIVPLRLAIGLPLVAGAAWSVTREMAAIDPCSIPLGRTTPAARLARGLDPPPRAWRTARAIRAAVPPDDRVLVVSHFITYYAGRECTADPHAGRSALARVLGSAATADDVARRFRRAGFGWLHFTDPGCRGYLGLPGYWEAPPRTAAAFRDFLASRGEVVWQTDGHLLWRIRPAGTNRRSIASPLPALPGLEVAAFAAADAALRSGDAAGALAAYDGSPGYLRDLGTTHMRRAGARIALGRLREAERDLDAALAAGLDAPRVRERRAWVRLALGRPAEARMDAALAVRMAPEDAGARATLAAIDAALTRSAR